MDKNTATNLIESTFNQSFDETRFELFAKNFLNDVEPKSNSYSGQYIWDDYKEHVNTYKRIGKYVDPDGEALDILIVEVKSVLKLERARTALRNFVIKHLVKFEKDFALVAFYSKQDEGADWRFSFIKLEHQAFIDEEKGKVKTRKEFTPAKRYSFLVGKYEKAYTAKNQLLPLLQNVSSNATIEEIESAFSIEKVTDEFFSQYKELFVKLHEHFEIDTNLQNELAKSKIDTSRFTKKLLGQIVFLYFLQKKGWLGVPKDKTWGNGQKRFIQQLFDTSKTDNKNFFKDYLQFLFYEALAKERDNVNSYYAKFNCRIPFLNGGLFEAEYDWKNANISIPENIFRNEEKNKSGDIGTGILDVFDRYNFTIKEDEPLDKEVAVDPEMLGKVFENMLEVTERKSKGAFYTPREIVHYMCQESLIHYLDNSLNNYTETFQEIGNSQTNMFGNEGKKGQHSINLSNQDIKVSKTDIETFVRNGHFALEHDQSVVNKGKETAEYKYILPESIRQNADLIDKKLTDVKICDPAIGSGAFPVGLLHELVNAHLVIKPHLSPAYLAEKLKAIKGENNGDELSESRYIYRLKRHIIQESIYGVDIDASAIDIARLRLWLSLVVDEDDFEPIETLPNLDYKIVCGNSLIGFPENWKSPAFDKLEMLKDEFFNEPNHNKKKETKKLIDKEIQDRLDSSEKVFGYKIDFDFRLFFSEVWHEKGGFDIVIGNPPYVKARDNSEKAQRKIIERLFYSPYKMWDIFIPFIEQGIRLSNSKCGINTMIIPDTIGVAEYTKKLTSLIDEKHNLKSIVFFPDQYLFQTATVRSKIVMVEKTKKSDTSRIVFNNSVYIELPTVLGNEKYLYEVSKLSLNFPNSIQLGDICYVSYGLRLNSDKGDPISFKKKDLISDIQTNTHSKEYTEGKYLNLYEIERKYWLEWNTERCPKRLVRPTFPELYTPNKLLLARQKRVATYSDTGIICDNTIILAVLHKDIGNVYNNSIKKYYDNVKIERVQGIKISESFKLKYLLPLINSSVINYFLKFYTKGRLDAYPDDWKVLPIIKANSETQDTFVLFTEYVILLKKFKDINELLIQFFIALLDSLSFDIYYNNVLKTANKEILKHLGDLKPITESMSDEEKLAVIQSEFERLYDPNHPVRNNLETLDSIEEVRIIKEALK